MDDTTHAAAKSPPIAVLMDDRESFDLMDRAMAETAGLVLEVGHLSVGDYLIDNILLVERKKYRTWCNPSSMADCSSRPIAWRCPGIPY